MMQAQGGLVLTPPHCI